MLSVRSWSRSDEDFLAGDQVGAVVLLDGLGLGAPTSEPACGSVRHMVPAHSPLSSFWK